MPPVLAKALSALREPSLLVKWSCRAAGRLTLGWYFTRLVRTAYQNQNAPERARIATKARVWYGLARGSPLSALLFLEQVYAAQQRLFRRGARDALGVTPIGFADVVVECTAADANTSRIYLCGFDESVTAFRAYAEHARAGTVAVDVGANIGLHSAVLSRCVGPTGAVYAYEPVSQLADRCARTLARNAATNVVLRRVGVSDRASRIPFRFDASAFNIGIGHYHPDAPQVIVTVRLDDDLRTVAARISLVKIDVEGLEVSVLRGAQRLLAAHRPVLIVEYNQTSWTLDDLKRSIPYAVDIRQLPTTLRDREGAVRDGITQGGNLLVRPLPPALTR